MVIAMYTAAAPCDQNSSNVYWQTVSGLVIHTVVNYKAITVVYIGLVCTKEHLC